MSDHLWKKFADPEYLKIYNESLIDTTVSTQIQVMRERRDWTQSDLAKRAGMKQSRISDMEDADYSSWTVTTLRRLAAAFGCGLIVRFAAPSEIVDWAESTSADAMNPPDFETEKRALESTERAQKRLSRGYPQVSQESRFTPRLVVGGNGGYQKNLPFMRADLRRIEQVRNGPSALQSAPRSAGQQTQIWTGVQHGQQTTAR